MGLATLIGGMATTIGTSTNLLVVGIAADLGERRFEMFDFALPVLIAGGAGLLFLWLVAPRLLPDRKALLSDTSPRLFSAVLYVNEGSFAAGKTLSEIRAKTEGRIRIERIQRTETLFVAKLPSVTLQVGDRLYVKDSSERLKEFEQALGATLYNVSDGEHPVSEGSSARHAGTATRRGCDYARFGFAPSHVECSPVQLAIRIVPVGDSSGAFGERRQR